MLSFSSSEFLLTTLMEFFFNDTNIVNVKCENIVKIFNFII